MARRAKDKPPLKTRCHLAGANGVPLPDTGGMGGSRQRCTYQAAIDRCCVASRTRRHGRKCRTCIAAGFRTSCARLSMHDWAARKKFCRLSESVARRTASSLSKPSPRPPVMGEAAGSCRGNKEPKTSVFSRKELVGGDQGGESRTAEAAMCEGQFCRSLHRLRKTFVTRAVSRLHFWSFS